MVWRLPQPARDVRFRHQDPGPDHASDPEPTQRTSAASPTTHPTGNLETLRFLLDLRHPGGIDDRCVDTHHPPDRPHLLANAARTTGPTPGFQPKRVSQRRGDTTYHPRPHAEPRTSGALSGTTGCSRPGSLASTPPTDAIERVRTQNRTGGDALGHTAPTPPVVWEQLSQSHVESCGRNNADAAASRVGCCGVGGRLDGVEGGVQPRITWRARGSPGGGSAWWRSAGGSP